MTYLSLKGRKGGNLVSQGCKGHKLTAKMLSFIDAYFGEALLNANKAVELSAYKTQKRVSAQSAELLGHPLIYAEIQRRQAIRQEKSEVKAEYLINKLMQIIEAEQVDNPQAALRAIELAGKSIALWKERQEISGPDGEAIRHEQNIKESVAEFTERITSIADRNSTDNVVQLHGVRQAEAT